MYVYVCMMYVCMCMYVYNKTKLLHDPTTMSTSTPPIEAYEKRERGVGIAPPPFVGTGGKPSNARTPSARSTCV